MSLKSMLTDKVDTYTLAVQQDGLSANFDDYVPSGSEVRCLANVLSAKSVIYYGSFGMQLDAIFGFDTDPGLKQYDLIKYDGSFYSVDGFRPIIRQKAWEARCVRYDPQRVKSPDE